MYEGLNTANAYFGYHLTPTYNIKSIQEKGLLPKYIVLTGHWDIIENSFKERKGIYFFDVWQEISLEKLIRDLIYSIYYLHPRNKYIADELAMYNALSYGNMSKENRRIFEKIVWEDVVKEYQDKYVITTLDFALLQVGIPTDQCVFRRGYNGELTDKLSLLTHCQSLSYDAPKRHKQYTHNNKRLYIHDKVIPANQLLFEKIVHVNIMNTDCIKINNSHIIKLPLDKFDNYDIL